MKKYDKIFVPVDTLPEIGKESFVITKDDHKQSIARVYASDVSSVQFTLEEQTNVIVLTEDELNQKDQRIKELESGIERIKELFNLTSIHRIAKLLLNKEPESTK